MLRKLERMFNPVLLKLRGVLKQISIAGRSGLISERKILSAVGKLGLFSSVATICFLQLGCTGSGLETAHADSVLDHYHSLHLSGFPKPPLDLLAPPAPTATINGHDLLRLKGDDLAAKAQDVADDLKNSEAAILQYWAVKRGVPGRYELSGYLARLGKTEESFYWLELAAMEDGILADGVEDDPDLENLHQDARWPKVLQFFQQCSDYWVRTGKAPKTENNEWFHPPDVLQRGKAIGSVATLPTILKKAFSDDSTLFQPMPEPLRNDWLSSFREPGQTFNEYVESDPTKPGMGQSVLYLQPLGSFSKDASPSLETLREFTEAFFQLPTKILPSIDLTETSVSSRTNPQTDKRQFLTSDIHTLLENDRPADAYAVVGITMEDLSTKSSDGTWWNYVFGEADIGNRVGVYSLARFDPDFFHKKRTNNFRKLILWRSCQTIAHELSHIFGVDHCTYFHCVMNGSNNLAEADRDPLHLCPVDLRKLQYSINFDVTKRYQMLRDFYSSVGIDDEAQWLDSRLVSLNKASQ